MVINNTSNGNPNFYFGLINEDDKDDKCVTDENIYYREDGESEIDKIIKGWHVYSKED